MCLANVGQVVRIVPSSLVPDEQTEEQKEKDKNLSSHLEVVDIGQNCVRYLPLPGDTKSYLLTKWNPKQVLLHALSNDVIVTVSPNGSVRLWETGASDLQKSFATWKTLVGDGDEPGSMQVTTINDII